MTPEDPFAGSEMPLGPEPQPEIHGNTIYVGLAERFPVWTLWDVLWVSLVGLIAISVGTIVSLLIAAGLPAFHNPSAQIASDPRVIVPGQIAGYLVLVSYVHRLITRHYQMNFAEAIRWNWPEFSWPGYLAGGAGLAIAIQVLSQFLPIPRQVPIDQMFRTPSGAWVMAIFGVAVAPLVEELYFRGLLFPALVRRVGIAAGIVVTSLLFALIHAPQLGKAWGPVLIVFLVGLTLTVVRSRAASVAASFFVHTGYNLTLFGLLYFSSDGFRNMEKLSRP